MGDVFVGGIVPAKIVVAIREVDIGFVKNCSPLER